MNKLIIKRLSPVVMPMVAASADPPSFGKPGTKLRAHPRNRSRCPSATARDRISAARFARRTMLHVHLPTVITLPDVYIYHVHSLCTLTMCTHHLYSVSNPADKIIGKIPVLYRVGSEDRSRPPLTVRAAIYACGTSSQYRVTDSHLSTGIVAVLLPDPAPDKAVAGKSARSVARYTALRVRFSGRVHYPKRTVRRELSYPPIRRKAARRIKRQKHLWTFPGATNRPFRPYLCRNLKLFAMTTQLYLLADALRTAA